MELRDGDDTEDGHAGVRHGHQARSDTVGKLGHVSLDGPSLLVAGVLLDDPREGARKAWLEAHGALAVYAGVSSGVAREPKEEVQQLEVGGKSELDLLEVEELDDGTEVGVVLRPPLTMGQDQSPVDPGVPLTLLLPGLQLFRLCKPG